MFFNIFKNFEEDIPPQSWILTPLKHPKNSKFNQSSKVMIPTSVLRDLAMFNFQPPFIFEICHHNQIFRTKCSVGEFVDYEGEITIPSWMFEQLNLEDSPDITLTYVQVPIGNGIKLLPHSIDFLEVENPKSDLENGLRDYPVLSYGDEIAVEFEDVGVLRFTITGITPENLDSIYTVDTDLNVEFDEPIGYQEKLESEKTVLRYISINEKDGIVDSEGLSLLLDFDGICKNEK